MAIVLMKSKHSFGICSVRFKHNNMSVSNSMKFTRIVLFSLGDLNIESLIDSIIFVLN